MLVQDSGSSSSDTSVEGELKLSPKKTLRPKKRILLPEPAEAEKVKQKMKAGVTDTKVCESPLNPPPIEKCGGKLKGKKGKQKCEEKMKRSQPWGPWSIAPIVRSSDDVQIGWGAICSKHTDPDHSLECKKQIGLSLKQRNEISVDEGRRLIKAWLLMGTMIEEHCHRPRSEHVVRTDPRTCHYTEAEFDETCVLLQG